MHSRGPGWQIHPGLIVIGRFQHRTGSKPQPCVQAKTNLPFVYDSVDCSFVDKGFGKSVSETTPAAFGGSDIGLREYLTEQVCQLHLQNRPICDCLIS